VDALDVLIRLAWLAGAATFVIGLMRMNSPATARNGNLLSAAGMALAVGATGVLLVKDGAGGIAWLIIAVGIAVGGGLGLYTARTVAMTAMPQLVSLFNAVGGGAAALIGIDEYIRLVDAPEAAPLTTTIFVVLDIVIGSVTFSGSLIASGKLMGLRITPSRPVQVPGGQLVTLALAVIVVGSAGYLFFVAESLPVMFIILAASLVFGVTMTLPIGGADMPVVISLLNSFTGTAVAMAGFVIDNVVLIIAGALVGASGAILTKLMADAMNRSVLNIMIGGFGGGDGVVGANDVTNPAARRPGSPVSGMPILDVDKAKQIVVIKRSMGRGYAGIDNELYTNPKTGMLFADAKAGLADLVAAVKAV
jgi:NAD(P) transhydrogenase subunit beta